MYELTFKVQWLTGRLGQRVSLLGEGKPSHVPSASLLS